MSAPYIKPQVVLHQEYAQAPATSVQNLNAVIIGPQYHLVRNDVENEHDQGYVGDYVSGSWQPTELPGVPELSLLDADYTKVYVEDALVRLAVMESDGVNTIAQVDPVNFNRIRAIPRVGAVTGAIATTLGGAHTGGSNLPEVYTLTPVGTFTGAAGGSFTYATSNGRSGTITVPAVTGADVMVSGVDGISFTVSDTTSYASTDSFSYTVFENDFVFATGNGADRYYALARDVKVGDRVKWTGVVNGVPATGVTRVTAVEADFIDATVADPVVVPAKATAAADITATLSGGIAGSVTAIGGSLLGGYTTGRTARSYTIQITTGGAPGVALATVSDNDGNVRNGVAITSDNKIYLGDGLQLAITGSASHIRGALYGVTSVSPLIAARTITANKLYLGSRDTTYTIEVIRGGALTRSAAAFKGTVANSTVDLAADIGNWDGGDVDDEYTVTVVTGGDITTARFSAVSQAGDFVPSFSFAAFDALRLVGTKGLKLKLTGTGSFTVGQSWVAKVFGARPLVRISDSAGVDQASTITVDSVNAFSVGLQGLTAAFPGNDCDYGGALTAGALIMGDKFTIIATAKAPAAYQTLVIADPIVSTNGVAHGTAVAANIETFNLEILSVEPKIEIPRKNLHTSAAPGSYNWTVTDGVLDVNDELLVLHNNAWVKIYSGEIFATYRALLRSFTSGIYSLAAAEDVASLLGPVTKDNPLAMGVYMAALNSAGKPIFFAGIETDDLDGYNGVLRRASVNSKLYSFTPTTSDKQVLVACQAHVDAMSSELNKKWRIAFGRTQDVKVIPVVDKSVNGDADFMAAITADTRKVGAPITKVTFTTNAQLLSRVAIGDTLKYAFGTNAYGETTYRSGIVAEVVSNTVCYLLHAIEAAIPVAQVAEIHHTRSTAERADAIRLESEAYGDHRFYNCFPASCTYINGETAGLEFAVCGISGLRASSVPHQPLTNAELKGVLDIPDAYSTFNAQELDTIASGGTLILAQDTIGGEVYIRHQLSTGRKSGILAKTELSMVANFDSVSYYFAQLLAPFIGRVNVTPETIELIHNQIQFGIGYLSSYTDAGLIGSQVIAEGSEILEVRQHPTLKDRIVAKIRLNLPAPLNHIEMHIEV